MFLGRLLLGQADEFTLGSSVHRAWPRSDRRSDRHEAASDATLRVVCHADRFLLPALAAQKKEIQRPGDPGLRVKLRHGAIPDRICARRSAGRSFWTDKSYWSFNFADDRDRCWRSSVNYADHSLAKSECANWIE